MVNFRVQVLLISLLVILVVSFVTFMLNKKEPSYKPGIYSDVDQAVNQAQVIFDQAKDRGIDFSNGPCLTESLLPDWVLDIAHDPRQPIDDLPENQCLTLRQGQTHHFVELDPEGKLIRAK